MPTVPTRMYFCSRSFLLEYFYPLHRCLHRTSITFTFG